MSELVHLSLQDATQRSGIAGDTDPQEVAQYTVSWSDLTTAGFAADDDVIIFTMFTLDAASATINSEASFGVGTTFASRTVLQTDRSESDNANPLRGGRILGFLDRRTLVENENFYTSIRIIGASIVPFLDDFSIIILKLDDLAAGDFRYAEDTSSGNAPTTVTDGASVTLPSGGGDDWLILGSGSWLVDATNTSAKTQLSLDGTVRMQQQFEGEDVEETLTFPLIGYMADASASAVAKIQYQGEVSAHDYTRSSIFALRLDAFADHIGNFEAGPVAAGTTVNVYKQTNTASLSLSATGSVAWFGQTIADITSGHNPYCRIQEGGTDIVAGLGFKGSAKRDVTDQFGLTNFGSISMASGTKVLDMDCAERWDTDDFNFTDSTLLAFSMELADGGGADNLLADDVQSTSEVSTPAVGQEHALLADAVQSTSEVTIPAISQEHALLADDIQSTSEVSAPILAEVGGGVDNLLAEDVQSMSEVSAPALGQEYALLAEDVQSMSEVSAPAISQTHTLLASDTESLSFVSNPTLDRQASGQPLTWANADTAFSGASAVDERPFIDSFI